MEPVQLGWGTLHLKQGWGWWILFLHLFLDTSATEKGSQFAIEGSFSIFVETSTRFYVPDPLCYEPTYELITNMSKLIYLWGDSGLGVLWFCLVWFGCGGGVFSAQI